MIQDQVNKTRRAKTRVSETFEEKVESTSRRKRSRLTSGVEAVIVGDVQANIGSNFTVGWPGLGSEPSLQNRGTLLGRSRRQLAHI